MDTLPIILKALECTIDEWFEIKDDDALELVRCVANSSVPAHDAKDFVARWIDDYDW